MTTVLREELKNQCYLIANFEHSFLNVTENCVIFLNLYAYKEKRKHAYEKN